MRNAPAPCAPPPAGAPRRTAKVAGGPTPAPAPPQPGRRQGTSLTVISRSGFPTRPRLVSSAHEPIRHVLLWYPPFAMRLGALHRIEKYLPR